MFLSVEGDGVAGESVCEERTLLPPKQVTVLPQRRNSGLADLNCVLQRLHSTVTLNCGLTLCG